MSLGKEKEMLVYNLDQACLTFVRCGQLWQNLTCVLATWNSIHRVKN